METDSFTISIGNLGVKTTEKRGHTPEEVADISSPTFIIPAEKALTNGF